MTTAPAHKAVRPKLNTTTNWTMPGGSTNPEPEEISPTWGYDWEQKKGHGRGDDADEQQVPPGVAMETLLSRSRDRLGSMSSDMLEEFRKIIKEEFAQAANDAHLKNSETDSPAKSPCFSPLSSQDSVFTAAYPSPPPSVVEVLSAPKASSPKERSPETSYAKLAPEPVSEPAPSTQRSPSTNSQPRAVHFRSSRPPVIHNPPRVDPQPESVSPLAAVPQFEFSSVDKAWGMLFDSEGFPTQRLNTVLRGLANFMMAEFGPSETLVVTPDKMLLLYTKYKIEPERFQYEDVFASRSKDALERIEFLYQDLDCQYHLVQGSPRSHPNVPGLTPIGFAKWMVSNILAYPDSEARRLHAVVSGLPINADGPLSGGKAERLPRQLSRHLFPESHDNKVRKILDEAIWDCLEDATPPLPAIPRARHGPSHDVVRLPEANTSFRRPGSGDLGRPVSVPRRSNTYDRGSHRPEPHPARLPRAYSDGGASLPRHRDLPPPPMGRHSVPQRKRSPPPTNRYSASLPAISQHHAGSPSSPYDMRGADANNYGVYPRREGRGSDSREESPRSPGFGRRDAGVDRGPTWGELYTRRESSSGRGSSVDAGSHRSFR
ncbi:hypothetical protein EsH8_II_000818 [Colletotrichum jinshuiense]